MKLFIPNPCSEDWAKMTPAEKGRHCAVCDHEVVDFTHFSNKKLVDFLDAQTGKVCGRISEQQLNRNLFIPEYESRNLLKRAVAVLALLGGASVGFAQEVPDTTISTSIQTESQLSPKDSISNGNRKNKVIIKGIVTNEIDEPIHWAKVIIYDEKDSILNGSFTEPDGSYLITIDEFQGFIRVETSWFNDKTESKRIELKPNDENIIVDFQLLNSGVLLGEIEIKKSRKRRLKKKNARNK